MLCIKFELVYSSEKLLNVLYSTLTLSNGFIEAESFAKPTDSHLYLVFGPIFFLTARKLGSDA